MLALLPHPARVVGAGGVEEKLELLQEAGVGPPAGLGLGHPRLDGQIEDATAQPPAVPIQEPGGGVAAAAAAAHQPSPPQPLSGRPQGFQC